MRVRRKAVKTQKRPPVILGRVPGHPKRAPVNLNQNKKRRKRPRRHRRIKSSQLLLTGKVKPPVCETLEESFFLPCECGVSRCYMFLSPFLFLTLLIRQVCVCERHQSRSQQQMCSALCCINKLKLASVHNFSHFIIFLIGRPSAQPYKRECLHLYS